MEGVAYRGRILVEIGVIDKVISKDKNRETIKIVDINSSNVCEDCYSNKYTIIVILL